MKILRLFCLGFALVCAAHIKPALGDEGTYDLSNFPGCVARNKETVAGDIPLTGLRYKSISQTETDDEHLHEAFLAQMQKMIRKKDEEKFGEELYVTFSVYYKYNKKVYKQIASAIICKNKFGTKDNDCRNRTYFFFSHLDPVTIANVLVDDIARFEPIVRRCVWDE